MFLKAIMKIIGFIVLGAVSLGAGCFFGFVGFKSEEGIHEVVTTYPVAAFEKGIKGVRSDYKL